MLYIKERIISKSRSTISEDKDSINSRESIEESSESESNSRSSNRSVAVAVDAGGAEAVRVIVRVRRAAQAIEKVRVVENVK
jgi:hypothetical protein